MVGGRLDNILVSAFSYITSKHTNIINRGQYGYNINLKNSLKNEKSVRLQRAAGTPRAYKSRCRKMAVIGDRRRSLICAMERFVSARL